MRIKSYFIEIKSRFLLTLLSWLSVLLVCYVYKELLLFSIIKQTFHTTKSFYFICTDVVEMFNVYAELIFFFGNQVLLFYILYHSLLFFAPGLFFSEYFYLRYAFNTCVINFIFSLIIFNKFIFPSCWNFFMDFQHFKLLKLTTVYFESKINEYICLYTTFYFMCSLYFQIIVFLFVLLRVLNIKKEWPQRSRKICYSFFIIFSTAITPPDVFSQILLSFCLILGCEFLIFYLIYRRL